MPESVKTGDRIKVVKHGLALNTGIEIGQLGTVIGRADDEDFVLVKFDNFEYGHCGDKDFLELHGFKFEEKDRSYWWIYWESIALLDAKTTPKKLFTVEVDSIDPFEPIRLLYIGFDEKKANDIYHEHNSVSMYEYDITETTVCEVKDNA